MRGLICRLIPQPAGRGGSRRETLYFRMHALEAYRLLDALPLAITPYAELFLEKQPLLYNHDLFEYGHDQDSVFLARPRRFRDFAIHRYPLYADVVPLEIFRNAKELFIDDTADSHPPCFNHTLVERNTLLDERNRAFRSFGCAHASLLYADGIVATL